MSYLTKIKRYAERNPGQSALFLYNAGVFSWLKTNAKGIVDLSQITDGPLSWLPLEYLDSAKSFLQTFPYGWLILSFIGTMLLRHVTRMVKNIIVLIIVFGGIYFMYGYAKTNGWL